MTRPLVFVLMSQRSGTSALVHTLNEHPDAAVGIERYKFRWPDWPGEYDASLFEAERFFDLDEADTNILGTERWDRYYARKREAWGPGTVSGDKVQPISTEMVRGILDVTPQARFLYPFRQLLPLASSYAVRARDPEDANWSEGRGADAGRRVWARDNRAVLQLLDDPDLGPAVLPVAYEDFFPGDPATIAAVLRHVGLGEAPAFDRAVVRNATRYAEVQGKELALTYEEVERLLPHVHDEAHSELVARAPSTDGRGHGDGPGPDGGAVYRLQQRIDTLERELASLRGRRSVRASLALADRLAPVVRAVRSRGDR